MLGNFKDAKRRIKQKALQTIGAATASDDRDFQREYHRFCRLEQSLRSLRIAMKSQIEALKSQTTSAASLALALAAFHGETAAGKSAKEIASVHAELERVQLASVEELYDTNVLKSMDMVLAKVPEIEEKVKQRKKLLLDHDAHLHKFLLAKSNAESHDPQHNAQASSSTNGGKILKPGTVFRGRKKSLGSISEELAARRLKLEHAEMAVDDITDEIMQQFNHIFDEFEDGSLIEGPMSAVLACQLHMAKNAHLRIDKVANQLPSVQNFALGLKKWDDDKEKLAPIDVEGVAHITNLGRASKRVTKIPPRRGSNSLLTGSARNLLGAGPPPGLVFSQPLSNGAPPVICDCIAYLRSQGLWRKGLFRVPGSDDTVRSLKRRYDGGARAALTQEAGVDINDVATLLKMYLRELPDSLIPSSAYEAFMGCVRGDHNGYSEKNLAALLQVIAGLPTPNQHVLGLLCSFLLEVSQFSEENKMNTVNLATCFAPSILRAPDDVPPNVVLHDMQNAIAATNILIINANRMKKPPLDLVRENTHVKLDESSEKLPRPPQAYPMGAKPTAPPPGLGYSKKKPSSPGRKSPRRAAPLPPPGLVNNARLTDISLHDVDDEL